jgi:hypothetical protein
VASSTAVATLHQVVMFIVDKVEQEDRRMLFVNELESITLPDSATQVPGSGACDAFSTVQYLPGRLSVG